MGGGGETTRVENRGETTGGETSCYLIRKLTMECVNENEFQENGAKLNATCHTLPRQVCKGQTDATYYFHSNVYFLTVDMQKMLW